MAGLTVIKIRRGTASAWTSANPVLAAGEMGYETDTLKLKIGDGSTAWNSLGYSATPAGYPSIVTSLPGSPSNGDEVYYKVGSGDTAVLWHLKYDSSITDSYKWRVLSMQDIRAQVDSDESTSSSSFGDLTTSGPSVTVPLAGVYDVEFGAGQYSAVNGGDANMSIAFGASAAVLADAVRFRCISTNGQIGIGNGSRILGRRTLAASDVVIAKYAAGNVAGAGHFFNRWLSVRPIRVG